MIEFNNDMGAVKISGDVISTVTGAAATNCFGVKGMAIRSSLDGIVHLLKGDSLSKGVGVEYHEDGSISVDLHIIVDNGVNMTAVCDSIMSEVRYVVGNCTGLAIRKINIYIDSVAIG